MAFWSNLRRLGRNRHYHRGILHYNRGEYAEAVEAFEASLASMRDASAPEYGLGTFYAAEARANLGLARFQRGDDARAEEDFKQALVHNPNYPDLHYYVALLCERTGRPEAAAGALERALALHPEYLEARLLYGIVRARMGDAAGARAELERCVALGFELPPGMSLEAGSPLGPSEWQALRARATRRNEATRRIAIAVEKSHAGDRVAAIESLREAALAEPTFPDVRCRLAALLAEENRHDEAIVELTVALEINPRYLEARTRLGLSLLALGRPLEAADEFARALKGAPDDADLAYFVAAAHFRAGDLDGVEQAIDQALERHPHLARAHRLRGLTLVAQGRHEEALGALTRALEGGREMPQAALDLGQLLLERGKAREAAKEFERALHWLPDTTDVHYALATALFAEGQPDAAEARLERALALEAAHAPSLFLRSRIHARRKRWIDARVDLERAAAAVPHWADVRYALGQACDRLGDAAAAERAYRDALTLNASFTDARVALAGILSRRGSPEAQEIIAGARAYDPLHPRARALDARTLPELLEEGVSG
jgi:tetratricopeptide (TPR) repeat protein